MKINYKNTALSFLDDPENMAFDIPEPHIAMSEGEKLRFGHSLRKEFKTAAPEFKKNIRYVCQPFMEAYMKNRHKLKDVFDQEELEECGTLIWKGDPSFTFTTFYYIKTTGKKDDWAANWMFIEFSKHTDNQFQHLDVLMSEFGDNVKQFIWKGHANTGVDRYYYLAFLVSFILFLKYVELETKVVNAKKRERHAGEKYVNETNHNIEILDSTWFTTITRSDSFKVGGHFKMQPYGPALQQRKLIWVSKYDKQGYTKKAKIPLHE